MQTLRRIPHGTTWLSLAVVLAVLPACSSDPPATGAPPPQSTSATQTMTPAPSPTTTPTPRSDADRALTQYRAFWRALPLASNELPARRRGILEKYLADPELNRTLEGMAAQDATGRRIYGENKPRATVTSLTGASAVITDCQDSSGSGVLDTASGRHLTVGVARNLVISDMRRDSEGVWRITSGRYQSRKC